MNYWVNAGSARTTFRCSDLAKMAVLFERHQRAICRYFLHLTGNRAAREDLAQEVFFRMLKYPYPYRGDSPFTASMYLILSLNLKCLNDGDIKVDRMDGGIDASQRRGPTHSLG